MIIVQGTVFDHTNIITFSWAYFDDVDVTLSIIVQ